MIHRVRKAFVLGAGLGIRLRPLTNLVPKPLLPIFGKPLITFALDHLRQAGIEKFWVNSHHLPEKFSAQFPAERISRDASRTGAMKRNCWRPEEASKTLRTGSGTRLLSFIAVIS